MQTQLDELLNKRGFMTRYLGRLFKLITESWQIFPIGVLFGLGFDTATEVALIAISVGVGASVSVPIWMILVLPLMFTCGMVLVDTNIIQIGTDPTPTLMAINATSVAVSKSKAFLSERSARTQLSV